MSNAGALVDDIRLLLSQNSSSGGGGAIFIHSVLYRVGERMAI